MARSAALLRAVNVGGRSLSMADLRRIVEEIGGRDVQTYLQSGNVVYSGPARLAGALERALRAELGFDVPVLGRTGAQLADVVRRKPYDATGKSVSVTFLAVPPASEALAAVDPAAYHPDTFVASGAELYLHTPDGYGRSKLTNAFWERRLGVAATTRNWNTVVALAEMTA